MKTVLAFGDSLTWGFDPTTRGRHPRSFRWPVALAEGLPETEVISEGLCGRTTVFDDPTDPADRCGLRALPIALNSHAPLDLVVIMLGTNDLKPNICGYAAEIEKGMQRLIRVIQDIKIDRPGCSTPAVLLVSPPPQVPSGDLHSPARIAESEKLASHYQALAQRLNVDFFDAATICSASPVDGVHLSAEDTQALGKALIPLCREILDRA
ncbi:MAG: SGNH/GDSL hydrolase family protein [Mangrovicoccus sp.]